MSRANALSQASQWAAVAVLALVALLLRGRGMDHGLPHWIEPDAELAEQVEHLRGDGQGARGAASVATYPILPALVTMALFEAPAPLPADATLEEHLATASKHFLDTRWAVALLSLLTLPGTFLLARQLVVAPGWALGATALTAVSFLHLNFAQQARPHAAAMAFYPWALYAMVRLHERGSAWMYAAAGAAVGLALGCLHNALALLPALLLAHLLRGRSRWLDPRALLALAALAASLWAFHPHLGDPAPPESVDQPTRSDSGLVIRLGNHEIDLARFKGAGAARIVRTLWWYEPGLLALLVFALGVLVFELVRARRAERPPAALTIVLGYVAPYLLVLALFSDTYERFLAPVLPLLAIFAARVLERFASSGVTQGLAVRATWSAVVVFTAFTSLRLGSLRAQPDTLEQAAAWLGANIDPRTDAVRLAPIPSRMRMDSAIDLPLARSSAALESRGGPKPRYYNLWSRYQMRVRSSGLPEPRFELEWLVAAVRGGADGSPGRVLNWRENARELFASSGAKYFVIERHVQGRLVGAHAELQLALEQHAERVAHFAPDDSGFPFAFQDRDEDPGDWPHVAWRTLNADAYGPVVEIWRLREDS